MVQTIFEVFIVFLPILLLLFGLVFGHEARGILALRRGTELTRPALEDEVLTTGPPGQSLFRIFGQTLRVLCC